MTNWRSSGQRAGRRAVWPPVRRTADVFADGAAARPALRVSFTNADHDEVPVGTGWWDVTPDQVGTGTGQTPVDTDQLATC
ncbi:MAG TPA: hypothetical protein VI248_23210 [Kineosporiaceae bacterium]